MAYKGLVTIRCHALVQHSPPWEAAQGFRPARPRLPATTREALPPVGGDPGRPAVPTRPISAVRPRNPLRAPAALPGSEPAGSQVAWPGPTEPASRGRGDTRAHLRARRRAAGWAAGDVPGRPGTHARRFRHSRRRPGRGKRPRKHDCDPCNAQIYLVSRSIKKPVFLKNTNLLIITSYLQVARLNATLGQPTCPRQ